MIIGKFYRKLKEAWCHLKQNEQLTPWSNAERKVKELKEGSDRKLNKPGTQERLWKDYLGLKSNVWSNTAHDI